MNNAFKRITALLTVAILVISGIGIYVHADETYNTRTGYPLLNDVRDLLDANEIVIPANRTIDKGDSCDVVEREWFGDNQSAAPFNIVLYDVTGPNGDAFSANVPGEYILYYIVVPVSGHPAYEISRKIVVRDMQPEVDEELPADTDEDAEDSEPEVLDEPTEIDTTPKDDPAEQENADAEAIPDEDEQNDPSDGETDDGSVEGSNEYEADNDAPADDDFEGETEDAAGDEEEVNAGDTDSEPASDEDNAADDSEDPDILLTGNADGDTAASEYEDSVPDEQDTSPEDDNTENSETTDPEENAPDGNEPEDNEPDNNEPEGNEPEGDPEDPTEDDDGSEDPEDDGSDDGEDNDDDIDPDNIVIHGDAKLERSTHLTYPSDLGDHSTFVYKIDGKVAYCLESTKASPKKGSFAQSVLENNPDVSKALYYGFSGAGDMSAEFYPNYEKDVRYILTHMAASYFYTGDYAAATTGCTSSGLAKYRFDEWVDYLRNMPDPPSTSISLSETNLTVVSTENGVETTSETKLKADSRNSITIDLPADVTYHNSNTGETVTGQTVTVYGGTTFYFTAPSTKEGTWNSGDMNGSINKIWKALVIKTGTKTQDLGCYAEESVSKSVSFNVEWEGTIDVTFAKVDSEHTDIGLSGATIGVYSDAACFHLLRQITTGQNGRTTVCLPRSYGTVYVRETRAPEGYNLNSTTYSVDLTEALSMTVMIKDDPIITPVYGQIHINKTGETLVGYSNGQFVYGACYMSGVTFEIYAAEDINEHGVFIAADELADTVTTDGSGDAYSKLLPIGTYYVIEADTAPGYLPDTEKHYVTLSEPNQDEVVTVQTISINNKRQKLSVSAVKESANGKHKLSGAVFALYAGQSIHVNGTEIVPAGTCLATVTTDSTGTAAFDLDLPFGKYLINEIKAPDGYLLSDEVRTIDASPNPASNRAIHITETFSDQPTRVAFSKADFTTGVELDGATLTLLDSSGRTIDTWVSDTDNPHMIEGLTIGATYTLREDTAPYGYLRSESVRFTLGESSSVQRVVMYDKVPTGSIIINKYGEFLADVSTFDEAWSWISGKFRYITGTLKNVTFDVYAYEDIHNADHVSADYYSAGQKVATITTDENGYAQLDDLPLGKYYVVETGTADGYVLDNKACVIDLSYRDSSTAVVTYSKDWQNERKKIRISILKLAENSGETLSDAAFGLYTGEDIKVDGKVILARDTLIEQKTTDSSGSLVFESDLPVGYEFYVKELLPPAGYASDQTVSYFRFEADSAQEQNFVFTDSVTKLEISKTDIAGEELPGAQLAIINSKGETVAAWTSTDEPHYIEMLSIGEYILREVSAPDGYVIAEDVSFRVYDSGEVQKVTMVNRTEAAATLGSYKTGDENTPVLWLTLIGLGLVALVAMYFNPWRRRH